MNTAFPTALSFFVAIVPSYTTGQNLVPNPSFEDYTTCPFNFGQWMYVVDWDSPYTMSADYFNTCSPDTICGVPFNHMGWQYPASGSAYMGLATSTPGSDYYREIITAELTQPLQAGVPVYLSFKISCGGYGSFTGNSARYSGRGPSMKFFVDLPTDWQSYLFPNGAALQMNQALIDTTIWTLLSGSYIPDSAYRYVAITNFFEDSMSFLALMDTVGQLPAAYAFIDDVCVTEDPAFCQFPDAIQSIERTGLRSQMNPFGDRLVLVLPAHELNGGSVRLYNSAGKVVREGWLADGQREIVFDTGSLTPGVFVATLMTTKGTTASCVLIHVSP